MANKFIPSILIISMFLTDSLGINITIQGSSRYVVPGQSFILTCIFGSNQTSVKYLTKNGITIGSLQLGLDRCYNVQPSIPVECDPSVCSCKQEGVFTARWTLSNLNDPVSNWLCEELGSVSTSLILRVAVPVSSVILDDISGSQIDVVAGQRTNLTCVTGETRPRSYIQWYIGNDNYTTSSRSTVTNGQDEMTSVKSLLTFTPTKNQTNLPVNCKAYNIDPHTTVELVTKPKLNVFFGPDDPVILIPPSLNYVINETYQLGPIECSVTCNPPCTYKWIKHGQNDVTGSNLTIYRIHRSQSGQYQCIAVNSVNNRTSTIVNVIVHYAAVITSLVISGNNFTIQEHSTPTISCSAEGLPKPKITFRYKKNNTAIFQKVDIQLQYRFSPARCEDSGLYECDAVNKFNPLLPIMKSIYVLCKPRAAEKPLRTGYALSSDTTLNITVPYLAYPRPTFQWFKNGSSTQITDARNNVSISTVVVNTYTFVTKFIRQNLRENDFGTYILKVSNAMGTKEDVFTVRKVGKPDQPFGGLATCIGYNTAVITWISGYNNGDEQTFSIVYETVDGTEKSSVSYIRDQGENKPISHSFLNLHESQTYIFAINSRNSFGESSPVEVNCSTTANANTDEPSNTCVAVGAVIGSIIILILIIVAVILVFLFRRFQTANAKGKDDMNKKEKNCSNQREHNSNEETNVYNVVVSEDAYSNTDSNGMEKSNYEALQMKNSQSKYEQIKMEDKPKVDGQDIYVNTAIRLT